MMGAPERIAVQLPRARRKKPCQNANDLARVAVGCMGLLARLELMIGDYISIMANEVLLYSSPKW